MAKFSWEKSERKSVVNSRVYKTLQKMIHLKICDTKFLECI